MRRPESPLGLCGHGPGGAPDALAGIPSAYRTFAILPNYCRGLALHERLPRIFMGELNRSSSVVGNVPRFYGLQSFRPSIGEFRHRSDCGIANRNRFHSRQSRHPRRFHPNPMNYHFVLSQRAPIQRYWLFQAHVFPKGPLAATSRDDLICILDDKAADVIHDLFIRDLAPNQFCACDRLLNIEPQQVSFELENPTAAGEGFQLRLLTPP